MLVEHDVEAELVGQQPLVVIAVNKIRGDARIALAVGQVDAQGALVVVPRVRIGLLGELIDAHARSLPAACRRCNNKAYVNLRSRGPGEGEYLLCELVGLLGVREMARSGQRRENCARDGGAIGAAVGLAQDAVMHAPEQQGRHRDAVQAALELGVVHIGRPGIARGGFPVAGRGLHCRIGHGLVVALGGGWVAVGQRPELVLGNGEDIDDVALLAIADLDADRIGEHEMGEAFGRFDRDLGRDPAAERHPHHDHVAQVELVEQIEIEIGEIVHGRERPRLLGAPEARMRRRQHPVARGEPRQRGRVGFDADAGMQKQQGSAGAPLDQFDLDAADGDEIRCCCHDSLPPPCRTRMGPHVRRPRSMIAEKP